MVTLNKVKCVLIILTTLIKRDHLEIVYTLLNY